MKRWLWAVMILFLGACAAETNNETQVENTAEVDESAPEEETLSTGSEDQSAETSFSLPRPSELAGASSESDIMSYERTGIEPHRIEIPAIGVDAEIEDVGLLPGGQMDEPSTMDGVAWYEGGYQPGEQGSSVMAGHIDSRTGPAVFFDLEDLEEGDEIIVTDESGEARVFVVQTSEAYDREDAPLQKIFGYSYRSQLNLITCTGEFNSEAGTHDQRLVVYTVLKEDLPS
ncbi:class F sortase [Alkalicoccus urumqiensis]|uniref:Class F sortase n=1 Tax=Alkalicoccus urumqiensis TaxID=1548213 RepID=A0A2P6MIG1_ALKUR|nr:class F sortase [Alkalicoccus urumqiensis]PRO66076.1 class F sortase [Alkalicoccus urumqiensis]